MVTKGEVVELRKVNCLLQILLFYSRFKFQQQQRGGAYGDIDDVDAERKGDRETSAIFIVLGIPCQQDNSFGRFSTKKMSLKDLQTLQSSIQRNETSLWPIVHVCISPSHVCYCRLVIRVCLLIPHFRFCFLKHFFLLYSYIKVNFTKVTYYRAINNENYICVVTP